jgi:hypothetical protein
MDAMPQRYKKIYLSLPSPKGEGSKNKEAVFSVEKQALN